MLAKKKKAFTLLELLVGLTVFTFAVGASIMGLIAFRSTTLLNSTLNDLVSLINTVENNAINSVSSTQKSRITGKENATPDFYMITFSDNNYSTYYCDLNSILLVCASEDLNIKKFTDSNISISSSCEAIAFKRLSSDIVKVNLQTGEYDTNGDCSISISSSQLSYDKKVLINLDGNTVSVK